MRKLAQKVSKRRIPKNGNPINKAFGVWKGLKSVDGVGYVRSIRDGANERSLRLKKLG